MPFYFSEVSLNYFLSIVLVTKRHLITTEAEEDPLDLMDLMTKIIGNFSEDGFSGAVLAEVGTFLLPLHPLSSAVETQFPLLEKGWRKSS